jgi:hypothetical protein
LRLRDGRRTWPGAADIGGGTAEHGYAGGGKKGLTCGTYMLAIEKEKRPFSGMSRPEGNTSFDEYAEATQAGWTKRGGDGL